MADSDIRAPMDRPTDRAERVRPAEPGPLLVEDLGGAQERVELR